MNCTYRRAFAIYIVIYDNSQFQFTFQNVDNFNIVHNDILQIFILLKTEYP